MGIKQELKNIDVKNSNNRLEFLKKYFNISRGIDNSYRTEYNMQPINMDMLKTLDYNDMDMLKNIILNHFRGAWGNSYDIDNNFNIKIVEYND